MSASAPAGTGAADALASPQAAGAPALARVMGVFGALLITLSNLSPSIGVFVVGSDVMHEAGAATFACFAAAAVLGVAIAAVYAELAAAMPEAGGEYTIVGRVLGPGWGFALLGLNLLTFSIAPAMTALGVAAYLDAVIPGLPPVPVALVLVTLCMAVSILNVRVNALVTGLFLLVELLSLLAVSAFGFGHVQRGLGALLVHPLALSGGGLKPVSVAALGVGAAAAIYAFDGYGSVVYLAEEIHDAPRRVARVVFLALGLGAVFLLVPLLAALLGAPDLKRLFAASSPLLAFVAEVGGRRASQVMSLGVAIALFNAMIASALMGGRQLYASGRDRAWPTRWNEAIAALHPRFQSPWVATLAIGAVSLAWCLVKLPVLVILIGDGTAAIYIGMCLAALRARRMRELRAPYRMPFFPLLPMLALAALAGVAFADLLDVEGRQGLAASGTTIVLSALYYFVFVRRRGGWSHRGPTAGASGDLRADAIAHPLRQ